MTIKDKPDSLKEDVKLKYGYSRRRKRGNHSNLSTRDYENNLGQLPDTGGQIPFYSSASTHFATSSIAFQNNYDSFHSTSTICSETHKKYPQLTKKYKHERGMGLHFQSELSVSDGNNSDDEHIAGHNKCNNLQSYDKSIAEKREEDLKRLLKKKGLEVKEMEGDGACLFRSVADQVYGDENMHDVVRAQVIDFMSKNKDHFSQYITEDIERYLERKRDLHCHGNHPEIQAITELYNRPVEIYSCSRELFTIHHGEYTTDNAPIRLSYDHNHYNSVIDPFAATVGVGLGLPGFKPGLVEKQAVCSAIVESEKTELEDAMLKDKLKESEISYVQERLEQQAACESYLTYVSEEQKKIKQNTNAGCSNINKKYSRTSTALCISTQHGRASPHYNQTSHNNTSTASILSGAATTRPNYRSVASGSSIFSNNISRSSRTPPLSPASAAAILVATSPQSLKSPSPPTCCAAGSSPVYLACDDSLMSAHMPPEMWGWDEDDILAQVVIESQKDYYESLRKNNNNSNNNCGASHSSSAAAGNCSNSCENSYNSSTCRNYHSNLPACNSDDD